ncbi:MAG: cytochrome b/b6 domain-containing protein [Phycisphaerae bacterium]|jgi:cytochrome b|nr:cytochrome b/b6 domain-containing protein [Phycisphaerae bacterium]
MERLLVWDAPVRLLHWSLAALTCIALAVGLLGDEDSLAFPYHMLAGLTAGLVVILRLAWGVVGTRHARLVAFPLSPSSLIRYVTAIASGQPERHAGHNPGSSYAIVLIFALVLTLATTGVLMGKGVEAVEEIHEISAYALVATIALHLAGVALHTLMHKENITRSMVDGRKAVDQRDAIGSSQAIAAIVLMAMVGAWAASLLLRYDAVSRTTRVPGMGWVIGLGEAESEGDSDDDDD